MILKPDPVYSFEITLQKVAFSIIICYLLVGFMAGSDWAFKYLDHPGYTSLAVVPLINGATVFLTNVFKQSIRKE